jgi:hypothetical protein
MSVQRFHRKVHPLIPDAITEIQQHRQLHALRNILARHAKRLAACSGRYFA